MGRLTDIGSRNIFTEEQVSKGRTHEKNDVLLDFFQITLPPALPPTPQFGQLVKLFSDVKIRDLKVSLEQKTPNILYIQPKKQFKVQIIGILEEIDSFY